MSIIDHLSVGVPEIEAACKFYNPLLSAIGCNRLADSDGFAAYGKDRVEFLIILPFDKKAPTGGNGTHICFVAPTREAVDAFYQTALKYGGTDEGAPGPREGYPIPDVYAAYLRDPFGNKLEVIYNGFANQ